MNPTTAPEIQEEAFSPEIIACATEYQQACTTYSLTMQRLGDNRYFQYGSYFLDIGKYLEQFDRATTEEAKEELRKKIEMATALGRQLLKDERYKDLNQDELKWVEWQAVARGRLEQRLESMTRFNKVFQPHFDALNPGDIVSRAHPVLKAKYQVTEDIPGDSVQITALPVVYGKDGKQFVLIKGKAVPVSEESNSTRRLARAA